MTDPVEGLFGQWLRLSQEALEGTSGVGRQMLHELASAQAALAPTYPPAAPPPDLGSGRWFAERGGAGGLAERNYRLFVPDDAADSRRVPLLVLLHGCGQDAAVFAACARAAAHARHKGFAVLLPEQSPECNPQRCWNWFAPEPVFALEVAALIAIIDRVCACHPVAAECIFALGLSAGGAMALALGLRHPQRFRAVGSHSGPLPVPPAGPREAVDDAAVALGQLGRGRPPPLILLQGDADPVVAPANAEACVALWRSLQGGAPGEAPRIEAMQRGDRRSYSQLDWGPRVAPEVRLVRVHGLGHAWSGGARGQGYADPKGPDALRLAWQFFAAHSG